MLKHEAKPEAVLAEEATWRLSHGDRFVRSWQSREVRPNELPTTTVLAIVHGLGDHSGRFDAMARWFASRGVDVYGFDQLGHGRSPGKRVIIHSYSQLLDDIDSFLSKLREKYPDSPIVLCGMSMGGNLVINYQLRGYSGADLTVAGSPMLRAVDPPGPLLMKLYEMLAKLLPNYTLETSPNPADLTRDPEAQRAFEVDPLVSKKISLRLAKVLIDSGAWALENAGQVSKPILLTHGDQDRITCHRATEEFASRANDNVELKLWKDGPHDLHHDTVRDEYFESVMQWMHAQIAES